ncbi:MAG: hypothetical protein WA172_05515 [Terriglobales bacterium]
MQTFFGALHLNWRQLLLVTFALAGSSFAWGITYTVTIDVTQSGRISYTYVTKPGDPPALASRLSVSSGKDTVCWVAKTSGTNHHILILFVKESPFQSDPSNAAKAQYMLIGTQADEANCAGPNKGIWGNVYAPAGAYKYYVAVLDDAKGETYTDDPQIIVGNGGYPLPMEMKREGSTKK